MTWHGGATSSPSAIRFGLETPRHCRPLKWTNLFNYVVSPSGSHTSIATITDESVQPFDRLVASPSRAVEGPLVTVVMSSFRRDATIKGAIQSILNQTWRSIELLVIDDVSGPQFDDLYDEIASMDPRVRVVRQRINGGTYLIRNRALTLARGRYITFQDSDDWSLPERIEKQIEPFLNDPSVVATQSHCLRFDEELDPVEVGYKKNLRRNESSLLFRTDAVRRVGFFHYTRKGGDSEYRLRLEAAYGKQTTMVGDKPLALVRTTRGSLSRNEFGPGYRHPARLLYSQGYTLLHKRARETGDFYRPLQEYRDSFLPQSFQPRRPAGNGWRLDVVLAIDLRLRDADKLKSWLLNTVRALRAKNLRIGVAHYVRFGIEKYRGDRLQDEIASLFVDGEVEPVEFRDQCRTSAVIVSEPGLLQHRPWGAGSWTVDRAYVRLAPSRPVSSEPYDDATVAHNCLRLFGVRPVWVSSDDDVRVLSELSRLQDVPELNELSLRGGALPSTARPANFDGHASNCADWQLVVRQEADSRTPSRWNPVTTVGPRIPKSLALAPGNRRWCAVVGWPIFGYETREEPQDAARVLCDAWQRGSDEFERVYADLGGDCVVVLSRDGDTTIRATVRSVSADCTPGGIRVEASLRNSPSNGNPGIGDEWVIPDSGSAHVNRIFGTVTCDGSALEELHQIIDWELERTAGSQRTLVLDDDVGSAAALGFVRDHVDRFEILVRAGSTQVSTFLRSKFIDYRTVAADSSRVSALGFDLAVENAHAGDRRGWLGTSLRAQRLAALVRSSEATSEVLDALWDGLSTIGGATAGVQRRLVGPGRRDGLPTARFITSDIQDARNLNALPLPRRKVHRLGVSPDLSRHEQLPLSAAFRRGESSRIVVSLAAGRTGSGGDFALSSEVPEMFPDHSLVLADTTFSGHELLEFGWFFGAVGDNIARRYAVLTEQMKLRLGCTDVVVRGTGRSALPAVLLASYLPGSVALVGALEAVAGDADREQIELLCQSFGASDSPEEFTAAFGGRLRLHEILETAPQPFDIVITDNARDSGDSAVRETANDPRVRFIAGGYKEWLINNSRTQEQK